MKVAQRSEASPPGRYNTDRMSSTPSDIMYSCGGDLNFLKNNGDIHPADFLRQVWAAGEDDQKLASWVAAQAR